VISGELECGKRLGFGEEKLVVVSKGKESMLDVGDGR